MVFENFSDRFLQEYKSITRDCEFLSVFGSEYCYAVICALKDYQKLQCAISSGSLIIKGEIKGETFFAPPVSRDAESFIKAVNDIVLYCGRNSIRVDIKNLTEEMYNLVKDDTRFYFEKNRDQAEYLYKAQDLIDLKGKKYHSKRNFINTFNNLYSYEFKKYDPSYLEIIDGLIQKWQESKYDYSDYERDAIIYTLQNIESCGNVYCDVLFAEGVIAGFIVGALNKHSDVNIIYEKADIQYKGIYAALLNHFIKEHFAGCRYINLQEDMGIEGLRTSKLSYHPAMLLEKYDISIRND